MTTTATDNKKITPPKEDKRPEFSFGSALKTCVPRVTLFILAIMALFTIGDWVYKNITEITAFMTVPFSDIAYVFTGIYLIAAILLLCICCCKTYKNAFPSAQWSIIGACLLISYVLLFTSLNLSLPEDETTLSVVYRLLDVVAFGLVSWIIYGFHKEEQEIEKNAEEKRKLEDKNEASKDKADLPK